MKISRRKLQNIIRETLLKEYSIPYPGSSILDDIYKIIIPQPDLIDLADQSEAILLEKELGTMIQEAYEEFCEEEEIGKTPAEQDIPIKFKELHDRANRREKIMIDVMRRFLNWITEEMMKDPESLTPPSLQEALGDRGDLPQKHQYKIGMKPEDLPWAEESFLGSQDWGDINDPYNPLADDDLVAMEMDDKPQIAFIDIPDKDPMFMEIAEEMGVEVQHIGDNAYVVDTHERVLEFTIACLRKEMGGAVSVSEDDALEYISLGRPV